MYTTASALLQAVYDDLKVPGRRTKGQYARNKNGNKVQPTSKSAVCWCTDGKRLHLFGVNDLGDLSHPSLTVWLSASSALKSVRPIKNGSISTNNDDLDDEQWAAWMEAAIQYAKAQEGK